MEIILANESLNDIRPLEDIDMNLDLGDTNDFVLTLNRNDLTDDLKPFNAVYIPGTEYGGILGETGSDTGIDDYTIGGRTWRGMMQDHIIQPPAGQAYMTVSGELNYVIKTMIEPAYPGIFYASVEDTGVTVTSFQFNRYTDLLSGLNRLLSSVGHKLQIRYIQRERGLTGYIEVSAAPIADYSENVEFSEDNQIDFRFTDKQNGITHLICLGKGELTEREVVHLYVQADGSIGTTQHYTGIRNREAVHENTSAETTEDLIEGGKERLRELMSYQQFEMDVSSLSADIDIGDIVGGRDYLSGFAIKKPITGKILDIEGDDVVLDYKIEGDNEDEDSIQRFDRTAGTGREAIE